MLELREERMALVRFERVPIEDKNASLLAGRYIAKDVDFAMVTAPYSRDVMKFKVDAWFVQLEADNASGRMPREWINTYKTHYDLWKKGQEIPLDGTPIRGWGLISPAQQEMLIRDNILTVESLANVNDQGMRAIGLGALDLKNKAIGWLKSINNSGNLAQEFAILRDENTQLKVNLEMMTKAVDELTREADAKRRKRGAANIIRLESDNDAVGNYN